MGVTPQSQKILDTVKEKCAQAAEPLAHVAKAGAEDVHTFIFDIGGLPDFPTRLIRTHPKHKAVFDQLAAIKRPVVYVFEIISATSPKVVRAAAESYRGGDRMMPAFRSNIEAASQCLYVGKVKSNFQARIIQHLGFGSTARTQALQLCHWARGLDLQLRLTAFEFRTDMADLLPLLEKSVASQLGPSIGKHQ